MFFVGVNKKRFYQSWHDLGSPLNSEPWFKRTAFKLLKPGGSVCVCVHVCVAMVYTLIVTSSQLKVIKSILQWHKWARKKMICLQFLSLSLTQMKFYAPQIILGWRNATNFVQHKILAWTSPNVWTTLGILLLHVCAYDEWMNEWMGHVS